MPCLFQIKEEHGHLEKLSKDQCLGNDKVYQCALGKKEEHKERKWFSDCESTEKNY